MKDGTQLPFVLPLTSLPHFISLQTTLHSFFFRCLPLSMRDYYQKQNDAAPKGISTKISDSLDSQKKINAEAEIEQRHSSTVNRNFLDENFFPRINDDIRGELANQIFIDKRARFKEEKALWQRRKEVLDLTYLLYNTDSAVPPAANALDSKVIANANIFPKLLASKVSESGHKTSIIQKTAQNSILTEELGKRPYFKLKCNPQEMITVLQKGYANTLMKDDFAEFLTKFFSWTKLNGFTLTLPSKTPDFSDFLHFLNTSTPYAPVTLRKPIENNFRNIRPSSAYKS